MTSGLEGAWTNEPTQWDNGFWENLFNYDYVLTKSPAGANQWTPSNPEAQNTVPDAHDPNKRHAPMMLTTDLALKLDPESTGPSPGASRRTRSSSPTPSARPGTSCCTVTWVRCRACWARGFRRRSCGRTRSRPSTTRCSTTRMSRPSRPRSWARGCPSPSWSSTAWASASTFRGTDKRGGANGARIRLAPQKDWEVNDPSELAKALQTLEGVQQDFNGSLSGGKKVSLADVIVIGGAAAIEQAAKAAGHTITVPVALGRTDASQDQTDVEASAVLEPKSDGFRNYFRSGDKLSPETAPRGQGVHAQSDRSRR